MASALVFVIACSNVASLILARSVRREGELRIRAALGARTGAVRRTLLAESLVLCGAGALLGVLLAYPMVSILARYAARFSVRALDVSVDATLMGVGVRITTGTSRHLRMFAVTQIAASFVLLVGAGALLAALVALQRAPTGLDMRRVLTLSVPVMSQGRTLDQIAAFYEEALRRIGSLPGVDRVAIGTQVLFVHTRTDPYALVTPVNVALPASSRNSSGDRPIPMSASHPSISAIRGS